MNRKDFSKFCTSCGKQFKVRSSYYKHIKMCQGQYQKKTLAFICKENNCYFQSNLSSTLIDHLKGIHGIEVTVLSHIFQKYSEFSAWKENFEKKSKGSFKYHSCRKTLKGRKEYYYCNRSGNYKSHSTGQRAPKPNGSRKIGHNCLASMKVFVEEAGKINVTLCPFHYGHENELTHLPMPKCEKEAIAKQLLQGIEPYNILRNSFSEASTERKHLCTKRDILNIKKAYGINQIEKHPNDLISHLVMKYILVTGGVISGIGKGVIASSIGKILKSNGYEVTAIKIDPYINIDAGTFSPYEHGEVFVLDDGGEVDLDLGNYERFMDIKLHRDNNITTGKIYQDVINKERQGKFLGKTVQVVPHITDAVQEWVERVALKPVSNDGTQPEICIIELGGTIGDIEGMPFVEAFRQFQFRVKRENFCCVHVSLVPQPKSTGEHKTKPTQSSVRKLRGLGLSPDIIVCRSELPINESVKEKISNFCHVPPEQVVCLHDVQSVYHVPIFLEEQGLVEFFHDHLKLPLKKLAADSSCDFRRCSREWRGFTRKIDTLMKEVKIGLVGKYTGLEDAYASVTKALSHASIQSNLKLNLKFIAATDLEEKTREQDAVRYHEAWQTLCKCEGIIVPGGFGLNGLEGKISAIKWARINKIPFLGICLGFQLAVVEYARNVLGWEFAHTYEVVKDESHDAEGNGVRNGNDSRKFVVIEMPDHHTGIMGGTMRLGKKRTTFKTKDSILRKLYNNKDSIEERHRHRYEVDKNFVPDLEKAGLKFVGEDDTHERLEILELSTADHPYFVAVQFHPEYISRPMRPSPPYLGLILACCGKLQSYLNKGCRHSPDVELDSSDDEMRIVENTADFIS